MNKGREKQQQKWSIRQMNQIKGHNIYANPKAVLLLLHVHWPETFKWGSTLNRSDNSSFRPSICLRFRNDHNKVIQGNVSLSLSVPLHTRCELHLHFYLTAISWETNSRQIVTMSAKDISIPCTIPFKFSMSSSCNPEHISMEIRENPSHCFVGQPSQRGTRTGNKIIKFFHPHVLRVVRFYIPQLSVG